MRRSGFTNRSAFLMIALGFSLFLSPGALRAQTPESVRNLIRDRVGSLDSLRVPPSDETMPHPSDALYDITPAKKRLGKFLYFDPIRANNIVTELGGVRSLAQSASCGSCHLGEMASKAGTVNAIGMGGEGRGMFDVTTGKFVARRGAMDGLTDLLPTQVDVHDGTGNLVMSGRFDAVDIPLRLSPSMIGFATNQRLFWSGPGGEPYDATDSAKLNLNVEGLPTGEAAVMFTFKAHRMFGTQRFALQKVPVYWELFRRAYPAEAAAADASGNKDDLINDSTIARAIATFLRTVITRNTPYDRFLAGDDSALTAKQLRGAELYFRRADQGGANCVACHSGFALNKVLGDEAGLLIEENFHNVGVGDHPMFALAQQTLGNADLHDPGRLEATGKESDRSKFKAPTLRQMKDAAPFTHAAAFTTLRQVVEYFNAGIPQSAVAASTGNLSPLFSNPRGPGATGLGLSDTDIDALVDFLENGVYDPAFVNFDPSSSTNSFNLNSADLTYPLDLMMLGAINGRVPSTLQHPSTDDLTGQDEAAQSANPCGNIGGLGLAGFFAPLCLGRRRRRKLPG